MSRYTLRNSWRIYIHSFSAQASVNKMAAMASRTPSFFQAAPVVSPLVRAYMQTSCVITGRSAASFRVTCGCIFKRALRAGLLSQLHNSAGYSRDSTSGQCTAATSVKIGSGIFNGPRDDQTLIQTITSTAYLIAAIYLA